MDAKKTTTTKNGAVTGAALKQAIEARDGRRLASFYADDALLRIVDRNNPPSKPRRNMRSSRPRNRRTVRVAARWRRFQP